jgi:hypothetical protein
MSARRRRAALSALGAVLAALVCAVLASSVDGSFHRGVLIALSLAWLVIAATCIAGVLRTEGAPRLPDPAGSDVPEPHTRIQNALGGSPLLDERQVRGDDEQA